MKISMDNGTLKLVIIAILLLAGVGVTEMMAVIP
jgi:hypothetical protein